MSLDIDKSNQEVLIRKLSHDEENPMSADSLVLRVAAAKSRLPCGKVGQRFWTLDHCRLWCMYNAGCSHIRVAVMLFGKTTDELFRECDGLDQRVKTSVAVKTTAKA